MEFYFGGLVGTLYFNAMQIMVLCLFVITSQCYVYL